MIDKETLEEAIDHASEISVAAATAVVVGVNAAMIAVMKRTDGDVPQELLDFTAEAEEYGTRYINLLPLEGKGL